MLHLLLLLSSLSVVIGTLLEKTFNISSCPMNFYGVTSDIVQFSLSEDKVHMTNYPYGEGVNDEFAMEGPYYDLEDVIMEMDVTLPDLMEEKLTNFTLYNTVQCTWKVTILAEGKGYTDLYYANIGSHSFLYAEGDFTGNWVGTALNSNEIDGSAFFEDDPTPHRYLFDLTGCQRTPGDEDVIVYDWTLKEKCLKFTGCTWNQSIVLEKMCHEFSKCNQGRCIIEQDLRCTAVASLVMDKMNNVQRLSDRCTYTLLSNTELGELHLLGKFNYRRSTHTPFLDSLQLTVGSNTFLLLQGGRVKVNETSVNLNSSVQLFNGAELSKDEHGVHLALSPLDGYLSISFDGTVAHISAPGHSQYRGLCLKSSKVKKNRRMDLSDSSCREEFNDEKHVSSDCAAVKKHWKSMFAKDSNRNITKACKDLLCNYGDLDGLSCHLQAAYTLSTGISLDNCEGSSPCLNHYCASHEFCGLMENDEAKCVCRESFIHPFRESGKYGENTVCTVDTASVELPICLVEDKGFDASELHLLDPNCKGQVNDEEHMITFKFTHSKICGTKISANQSHIIYKNTVTIFNPEDDTITRDDMIYLNFSCSYEQPESSPMTIKILDGSVIQMFMMGLYKYSLVQKACSDHMGEKELKPGDKQKLGETMWIHLDVEKLDSRVALVIDSCWGSVQTSGEGELRHNLITDRCADPGDHTVTVTENGDGDHCSFSFKVFRFLKHPGVVHMHCTVSLCLKGENNRCRPRCGGEGPIPLVRFHRSVASLGTTTFTSVSWIDQGGAGPVKDD